MTCFVCACAGLLISGDDRGNIWMYNVEDFVKMPQVCDEALKPSRVRARAFYPNLYV